jgi:hypothetical protein
MAVTVPVDSLTRDIFSLDEPWRGRFLRLVASRASAQGEDELHLTPEEVAAWFEESPTLYRWIALLLRVWHEPKKQPVGELECTLASDYRGDGPQQNLAVKP